MDRNLFHVSYEGGILEDPWAEPPEKMFLLTVSPEQALDYPTYVEVDFDAGTPVAVDGQRLGPVALLEGLNRLGGEHGVGRVDLVENRFVGMKSRGVYGTPGGTILHAAHRALESITLDRETLHLRDSLVSRYAEMVYYGYWYAPEREALQRLMEEAARRDRYRAAQALQGERHGGRAPVPPVPLPPGHRHVRGRRGLPAAGRRGVHPAERAAAPYPRVARPVAGPITVASFISVVARSACGLASVPPLRWGRRRGSQKGATSPKGRRPFRTIPQAPEASGVPEAAGRRRREQMNSVATRWTNAAYASARLLPASLICSVLDPALEVEH